MLRALSSRLLAMVTSTMAASGTPATTIAITVSKMIITSTSRGSGGCITRGVCALPPERLALASP